MSDSFFKKFKAPPSSVMLGWTLIAIHQDSRSMEIGFEGKPEFVNPLGFVQGGILTAMLDDAMGPLIPVFTGGQQMMTSVEIKVSFLQPAKVGKLRVVSRIIQMGKTIAFLEADIFDPEGQCLAKASSTARLITTSRLSLEQPE